MKTFEYYQDQKVTMWQRLYFSVEAKNKKEADEIVRENASQDIEAWGDIDDDEDLTDTIEYLSVEDNQGQPTVETFDKNGKHLGGNGEQQYF